MTRPPLQDTRFNRLQEQLASQFFGWLGGSWLEKSVGLLSLLGGAYIAANITSIYLNLVNLQSIGALGMLLIVELLVRLRSRWAGAKPELTWVALDNLRIGAVYSVVLEGFKLGS
jgi:hypothetical protein